MEWIPAFAGMTREPPSAYRDYDSSPQAGGTEVSKSWYFTGFLPVKY
jgi:hypothetical protein